MLRRIYRGVRKILKRFALKLKKKVPVYIPKYQSDLLTDRVVFITGGSSGIGYSIAEACLHSGASVIIAGRNKEKLDIASNKLQEDNLFKDKVFSIVLDIANIKACETVIDDIEKLLNGKKIDTLINNAGLGTSSLINGAFNSISEADYDKVMGTNLKGTYFLSRAFARYMIKNKIQGNILNIGSSSCLRPAASAYTLTKWGVRGMTLGLAKTLIPYGIVVNGIAPGPTSTPMHVHGIYKPGEDLTSQIPMGRDATPEEIANFAVVMISGMGRMIVGDMVYMTGGAGLITFDDVSYEI